MQHINFCSQLDRVIEPPFSARQLLWVVSAAVIVMLVIYSLLWLGTNSMSAEMVALQDQQLTVSDELQQLKSTKEKLQRDKTLFNEVAQLKAEVAFRRRLLSSIDPAASTGKNFSHQLTGLAQQNIDGLWFTVIKLRDGGERLVLQGKTNKADLLPRFLQKISAESIFSGHQFRVFRMNVAAERVDLLDFELRSSEAEMD